MKRFAIWLSVLSLVAFFAPLAVACPKEKGKMMEKMGLSPDQQKQMEKLHSTLMEKVTPLKAQMEVKKAELKVLWLAENPDKKAIMAKTAEIDAIKQKKHEAKVDFKLATLKLLNAEQRSKFSAMPCDKEGKEKGEHGGCGCKGGCDCGGGGGGCGCGMKGGHEKGQMHEKESECPMHKGGK